MKKASGHILCLMLAFAYVFGYAGFGIHTCHEDGSRHFVLMLGEVSCESIHHHSHDADHDHHHDDGCCTTNVYVVTDAQDSANGAETSLELPATILPVVFETPCLAESVPGHLSVRISHAPPLPEPSLLPLLSVWRV